jgi:tRNA/rRNA methyltransferase
MIMQKIEMVVPQNYMPSFCFILVRPRVPENVGAAARALKTMGFNELRLVDSVVHRDGKAVRLAHGSRDLLDNAAVFDSLGAALADCGFGVATTARRRYGRTEYFTPGEALERIREKGPAIGKAALVFGGEEAGLSNAELNSCDIVSSIPMAVEFPSLNLGQAVMLYAHLFSRNIPLGGRERPVRGKNPALQFTTLKHGVDHALSALGYDLKSPVAGRIRDRVASLRESDVKLAHSVVKRIRTRLGKQEHIPSIKRDVLNT